MDSIMRSKANFTTPKHVRSFVGRCIWIYTGSGEVELTDSCLVVRYSGRDDLYIPYASLSDVRLGTYSTWAKPTILAYVEVIFGNDAESSSVLFTPYLLQLSPTWETNKLVAAWYEALCERSGIMPADDQLAHTRGGLRGGHFWMLALFLVPMLGLVLFHTAINKEWLPKVTPVAVFGFFFLIAVASGTTTVLLMQWWHRRKLRQLERPS